ncbi:AMP-binding protein [Mycolicibacterium thermoresistibile]
MNALLERLYAHGERPAVLTDGLQLSYRELADRVAGVAGELGTDRRLVLLHTRNDVPTLVHYLAALAAGHVVLPVNADGDHTAMMHTYSPDVLIDGDGIHRLRSGSAHRLHDDLALLLSTSGSTGSPKLVRLSYANLLSNARAISEYLGITESDRAATTLPMSYCYGLSVIHSHLLRGAALILTEQSVLDQDFWTLFRRHRGTTFAGVPYTFDLLDRIGFDAVDLPHLRYVTQAGGRLAPERVRRFARLGRQRGWQLFVMYGATEATARMAYLPPELAEQRPDAIGRPIPGGSFTIEPVDGFDDAGELVYRGPNVMMGYAQDPMDLARGRTVEALRTGDIARRAADGLYEVIGRRSRFVKLYGLRIDLQRLETALSERGITALCTGDDEHLAIAATGRHDAAEIQRVAAEAAGVPGAAVRAAVVAELPMLSSGKPDYPAVRRLTRPAESRATTTDGAVDLRAVFAEVLHLDADSIDPDASFIDLGGTSLTYVTMSVRLQRALGRLPVDWQRIPVRELERSTGTGRHRWWSATMETSVALRAAAIVLIVGSHAGLFELWGGAHILLGVVGYNFARFCLTPVSRADRIRQLRSTIGWIAVPAMCWIAVALVITDDYHLSNLLLVQKFVGPHDSTAGRLWFIEVLVWILIAMAVLCWIPLSDRLERRHSFEFALAFLAVGMLLRYNVFGLQMGPDAWSTVLAFWFFAAGWAAAKAGTVGQRLLVTAVLAVGMIGYFDDPQRELLVLAGLALLIWLPVIRCPAPLTTVAGVVAEASLYTYLTHFQVYPLFGDHRLAGALASIAVGIALTAVVTRLRGSARRLLPVRDEPLLRQGGGDDPVGADQAGVDHTAAPARGR